MLLSSLSAGARLLSAARGRTGSVAAAARPRLQSAAAAAGEPPLGPRLLTRRLTDAVTGSDLLGLVEAHEAELNEIHASVALTKLSKLQPVDRWKEDERTLRLLALAGDKVGVMGPQALSNSLVAVAKLGLAPTAEWTGAWLAASADKLASFQPQELAGAERALRQLGVEPGAAWADAYAKAASASTSSE